MTMPANNIGPTKLVELPAPQFPMLTRMISNALFFERGKEETITWAVAQPHPLVPDMKVIRMFDEDRGGVEIYSVSLDGKNGMRNRIPAHMVRFIEEAMPLDVFVEELTDAESTDDDEDDDPPYIDEEPPFDPPSGSPTITP